MLSKKSINVENFKNLQKTEIVQLFKYIV